MTIPVYRLTSDCYYAELDTFTKKNMYPGPPDQDELRRQFYLRNPDRETFFKERLCTDFGGTWYFNEIIGYLDLYFLGSQIRGEYWQMKGKRIRRTRKKEFEFITFKLSPELTISEGASNSDIFGLIHKYLSRCAKELKNGRHFDTRCLDKIGPFVDWRTLISKNEQ